MQGPRNAQTMSKASFVECLSEAGRNDFLEKAKNQSFRSSSGTVRVQPANPKFKKHRDWALDKATGLLRSVAPGKAVQADFKNRIVNVDGAKIFEQSKTDLEEVFAPPFTFFL
ncbi:unnamed protein product [Prorocentrum cordatum]|uniref:Uncharacterized protein n=1 Tax=Prorocentrum cordatum TaxID=2364126 RepID=A0ABN9QFE4_9DINO|nr:unnamed protein product [Polarella glacialis]